MDTQTTQMLFRLPQVIKTEFFEILKDRGDTATDIIIKSIKEYIDNHKDLITEGDKIDRLEKRLYELQQRVKTLEDKEN